MSPLVRVLLPTLIALDIAWQSFSPEKIFAREVLLYNLIWVIALVMVLNSSLEIDRLAISAIALAITFWGLGSLTSSLDEMLLQSPRFSAVSQICYYLFYPIILIAIPRLAPSLIKVNPLQLLDLLIFGLGFSSLISLPIIIFLFPAGSILASNSSSLIFYLLGDIALLLVTTISLITNRINFQRALFSLGILIFVITDIYYLLLTVGNRYQFGSHADDGWLLAIAVFSIALTFPTEKILKPRLIHPALVAVSIFISPILLAISALHPNIFPIYIMAPLIAILVLAFIRMSSALRHAEILGRERILARTDELTGLANRRRLLAELASFSNIEGALMLLDLNEFKPVNDQYGHETGDSILREAAKRFNRALPSTALLARLGGDEFGVLIRGTIEETLEAANALRAALSYPFNIEGRSIMVGVSVGIAHNDGSGGLLKRADSAMYLAKNSDAGVVRS